MLNFPRCCQVAGVRVRCRGEPTNPTRVLLPHTRFRVAAAMPAAVAHHDDGDYRGDKRRKGRDDCSLAVNLSVPKLVCIAVFGVMLLLAPPSKFVQWLDQLQKEAGTTAEGGHNPMFGRGGGVRTRPLGGSSPTTDEKAEMCKIDSQCAVQKPRLGEISKLGRAVEMAGLAADLEFDEDSWHCGDGSPTMEEVKTKTLALIAITYKAPLSLRASMVTWQTSGLLELADELILFINSPSKRDFDIAEEFGFTVMTTTEQNGNIMAGPALAYAVANCTSDYVLFMEKDFQAISDRQTTVEEMWSAIWHMARGVEVFRLRGKTDHPAEGMPDCCTPGRDDKPQCPFNSDWKTAGSFADHMNWLFIFCDPDVIEKSNGRVVQCTSQPQSLCFTSAESNWSNNPVIFGRQWFNRRLRGVALTGEHAWDDNRYLEFNIMMSWLAWRPPARICASYWGIFKHVEIDQ